MGAPADGICLNGGFDRLCRWGPDRIGHQNAELRPFNRACLWCQKVYAVYMGARDDIFNAGLAAFEEHGEAGLSLRDVAARVGVTPMALYRHFKNRQALLDAIVAHAVQEWRARVARIRPCAPSDWLLKIGEAFLAYSFERPRMFEAAFLTASTGALRYPDDFAAGGSPAVTLQMKLLEQMAKPNRIKPPIAPLEMVIILAGLAQGLISLYRAGRIVGDEKSFRLLYHRALKNCVRSFELE